MGWTISLTPARPQDAREAGIPEASAGWPQSVEEFELLVTAVQDELVHFAYCRLHNQADAEDAVQDVLVRSYLDREKHRMVTGVRPYLFRMVANRCTDLLRRRQRADRWRTPPEFAAGPEPDPLVDRLQEVERLLIRLPRRQAEAIRLRVFGGLSFSAIAEAVGVSLPTIKSRFRYGVERLRSILTKEAGQ